MQRVEQVGCVSRVRNGRPDDRDHTGGLGLRGGLGLESSPCCRAVTSGGWLPRTGLGTPRCVPLACKRREVIQERLAVLREDRLRVELDAPQGQGAVLDALDDAVLGSSGDAQGLHDLGRGQRVIADGAERCGDPREQTGPVVLDGGDPPVPRLRRVTHVRSVQVSDELVTQADAQDGDAGGGHGLGADAHVLWTQRGAGTRGQDHAVDRLQHQRIPAVPVVGDQQRLAAIHPCQQVEEVEGERVVIIDEERAKRRPGPLMHEAIVPAPAGWRHPPAHRHAPPARA